MHILAYIALLGGIWLLGHIPTIVGFFFRAFCGYVVSGFVTPPGHRRYGSFKDAEGYQTLDSGGFEVESWWASDSVSKIEKN